MNESVQTLITIGSGIAGWVAGSKLGGKYSEWTSVAGGLAGLFVGMYVAHWNDPPFTFRSGVLSQADETRILKEELGELNGRLDTKNVKVASYMKAAGQYIKQAESILRGREQADFNAPEWNKVSTYLHGAESYMTAAEKVGR